MLMYRPQLFLWKGLQSPPRSSVPFKLGMIHQLAFSKKRGWPEVLGLWPPWRERLHRAQLCKGQGGSHGHRNPRWGRQARGGVWWERGEIQQSEESISKRLSGSADSRGQGSYLCLVPWACYSNICLLSVLREQAWGPGALTSFNQRRREKRLGVPINVCVRLNAYPLSWAWYVSFPPFLFVILQNI